ncbi:MAG: hypothetical protein PHO10_06980 [Gemmiger sp.]|nr:hypothetical protein [Gemmiger sp.]
MEPLPQKKRMRLQGYDYSQGGGYFITICTKNREHFFGEIRGGIMYLNQIGEIASRHIRQIENHIAGAMVLKFVVMPNHIHIILMVDCPIIGAAGTLPAGPVLDTLPAWPPRMVPLREKSKQTVPRAMQQFKASVTRETRVKGLWHPRFHDHILRNAQECQEIGAYIDTNPLNWAADCFYQNETTPAWV